MELTPPGRVRAGRSFGAFVLTDMVKSTELRHELGTEVFEALVKWHFAVLTTAVARHGGVTMKRTGDGLLAAFSSAASAVEAAADMQRAVHEHVRPDDPTGRVAIRIGVSAGDVDWQGDDATGHALVEAARLEPLAGAEGIAVSDVAVALARERARVGFGPRQTAPAKGLSLPLGFTELRWREMLSAPALLDMADPGIPLERFVGRVDEQVELVDLWETVGRHRHLVVICGHAGIGKTELARAFGARLHARGRWVMQGRCDERELVPFQPFAEMFSFLFSHLPDGPILLEQWGERLAPLLPNRAPIAPVPPKLDEADRFRLFEAVSAFFETLSIGHPVMLLVDDLGAADGQTLELLEYLVRRPGLGSVLIVGTARPPGAGQTEEYVRFFERVLRSTEDFSTLDLGGIDAGAVAAIVARETGFPLTQTEGRVGEYLAVYTGGNPLHLKAVLADLSPQVLIDLQAGRYGPEEPSPIDVPTAVIEDIRRIHQELDDEGRSLIEIGAVVGYRFRPGLVQEVLGFDDLTMDRALDTAMASGVVTQTGLQPPEFRFSHPLVHDAMVAVIGFHGARLHTIVGRTLRRLERDGSTRLLRELSNHLSYSERREEQLDAASFAEMAAHQASVSFAHGVAAAQYKRALDLYTSVGAPMSVEHEFDLLLALGRAQRNAGDPRAQATLTRAAEHAETHGDGHGMAAAVLAGQPSLWSLTGDVNEDRVDLIDRALYLIGDKSSADRASLLGAKAAELTFANEVDQRAERDRISLEAIEMTPAGSDSRTRFKVLELRISVLQHPDGLAEREGLLAEMEQLAVASHSPAKQFGAASLGYWTALEARSGQLRQRRLRVIERIAERISHPRLLCLLCHWQGIEDQLQGRFEAALEKAKRTYYMMKALGEADAEVWYIGARYIPYRFLDRLDDLVKDLESRITIAPGWVGMRAGLALAHARGGRLEEARRVLDTIHIDRLTDQRTHHDRMANMALVAETLSHLPDHPQRARVCEVMESWADRTAFNGTACFGAVAHYRGLLLRTLDRPLEAVAAFELAVLTNAELGAPALLADSKAELAGALLGGGHLIDAPDVGDLLASASNVAQDLGLSTVRRRCAEIEAQAEGPGLVSARFPSRRTWDSG